MWSKSNLNFVINWKGCLIRKSSSSKKRKLYASGKLVTKKTIKSHACIKLWISRSSDQTGLSHFLSFSRLRISPWWATTGEAWLRPDQNLPDKIQNLRRLFWNKCNSPHSTLNLQMPIYHINRFQSLTSAKLSPSWIFQMNDEWVSHQYPDCS